MLDAPVVGWIIIAFGLLSMFIGVTMAVFRCFGQPSTCSHLW
jgi:formate hydrogenlyase subunit 3/multisubunit Na+/H+ antiporter MnhD subunit